MINQRVGLGLTAPIASATLRHCYVQRSALDRLLDTPGVLSQLLMELTGESGEGLSVADQLVQLKRAIIRLSVTPTPFHGLSLEEIIVLCVYTSGQFDGTDAKRALSARPSPQALAAACYAWLKERTSTVVNGAACGVPVWPVVGYSSTTPHMAGRFVVGVAPLGDADALDRDLEALAGAAGFAHEHYVACAPSTALAYLQRAALSGGALRWDPFALDRRLRSLDLGLLLVEGASVSIYLPARYNPLLSGALIPQHGESIGS